MKIRGLVHSDFFSRHWLLVIIIDLLIIVASVFALSTNSVSFAKSADATFPYKTCYTVTAYYSPLPDQERYGRGSYEAEVIFEGRGTHSADGTSVYPGMLAAPPEIPFLTKIYIPGIGTGTVHDRGGAIKSGDDCNGRLDAWMGYGEEGLERALNWGMRKVEVTIYGIDDSIEENIVLEGYLETEKILREKIPFLSPQIFQRDLGLLDSGDEVKRLQKHLKELGYFEGEETGIYDDKTKNAVLAFQLYYGIVSSPDDFGAGYFGVNTRRKIDFAIKTFDEKTYGKFTYGLGLGSYGREVRRLQKYLVKLGYLDRNFVTSEYDKNSEKAVLEFQLDNNVISSPDELGAGYFGPKTRESFNERIKELNTNPISLILEDMVEEIEEIKESEEPEETEKPEETEEPVVSQEVLAKYPDLQEDYDFIREGLTIGDTGEDVQKLQKELRNLGYLRIDPTGYFGPVTSHAVFKLQQNWGFVEDKGSYGAGYVGPKTMEMLNQIISDRVQTKRLIAAKREDIFIAKMKETPIAASESEENDTVVADAALSEKSKLRSQGEQMSKVDSIEQSVDQDWRTLKYGDRGEDVKELQKKLRELGYFKGFLLTEYFGNITKEAVIAFQLSNEIIESESDIGAGVVGSETRKKLRG